MPLNIIKILLSLLFYISLIRATNITIITASDSGEDITQTILNAILLLLLVGYLFLNNDYRFIRFLTRYPLAILFILVLLCSIFYSVSIMASVKYLITLLVISLPPILYLLQYGTEQLLKSLSLYICFMSIANLLFILAFPQYGIMPWPHEGLWSGFMQHKNIFGSFMAMGAVILFYQCVHAHSSLVLRFIFFVSAIICLLCMVKAGSTTALVCFAFLVLCYPLLFLAYHLHITQRFVFLLGLVCVAPLLIIMMGPFISSLIFELTGKEATFTGRTDIWLGLWQIVMERPLFGHGAGMAERSDYISRFQTLMGKDANSTHNSYLSLFINYGIPLTIIITGYAIVILFQGLIQYPQTRQQRSYLILATSLIMGVLLIGFAESGMIFSRSIFWVYMLFGMVLIKLTSISIRMTKIIPPGPQETPTIEKKQGAE